jgi:hypothetical protein
VNFVMPISSGGRYSDENIALLVTRFFFVKSIVALHFSKVSPLISL